MHRSERLHHIRGSKQSPAGSSGLRPASLKSRLHPVLHHRQRDAHRSRDVWQHQRHHLHLIGTASALGAVVKRHLQLGCASAATFKFQRWHLTAFIRLHDDGIEQKGPVLQSPSAHLPARSIPS